MSYTIEQFMWGYQQHFQISFQVFVERILDNIDPYLEPKTLLIGVLVDDIKDRHEICIEPEDCGLHQPMFEDVKKLANELLKADSETKIFQTHPIAQKHQDERIAKNSFKEAIQKILEREFAYSDILSFVSFPNYKDGYWIFPIIQLKKSAYNKHYHLHINKLNDRYNLSTSLLEATIIQILEIVRSELHVPDAGAYTSFSDFDTDEIMKRSGKNFMYTVSSKGDNFEGLHGLFDACNIISSLKYENEPVFGKMIIAPIKHDNVRITLKLDTPINIKEYRKVRKFLELTSSKNNIISDSAMIYGLGEIRGQYNPVLENLFEIRFTGHYQWELLHSNNKLMNVSYNVPSVPQFKINKEKFYSDFSRIFPLSKENDADTIFAIIEEAINQKHGTMLVVSDGAKDEAERLKNQSFKIEETFIDSSFIQKITAIDGAILLDYNGKCYSIGVILDGLAVSKGSSARGARFNSAIRYYEFAKKKNNLLILIVSEDGMIDFIPNLKPQILKSTLIKMIDKLEKLKLERSISIKEFNRLSEDIYNYEFYFSKEQCDIINSIRKDIEDRLWKEHEGYMQIVRNDLEPSSEMNDSYFLEE